MCIVTFGVVGARLWARFWVKKRSGVDDWLIIAAMVSLADSYRVYVCHVCEGMKS